VIGVGVLGPVGSGLIARDPAAAAGPADGRARDPEREAERDAWAVLASVSGLGPVGLAALLERYRTARAVLAEASDPGGVVRLARPTIESGEAGDVAPPRWPITAELARAIASAGDRAGSILARIGALGLVVVTLEDVRYPGRLGAIDLPPHVLFVHGDLGALDAAHAVAVVGTRRASLHGRATASRIAAAVARHGATVVSGLAVGIDGAAHDATIEAGGTTVAVIGSGHAALYPRVHSRLADSIIRSGGAVVSELPPDTKPTTGTFPRRNRVISGLTDATVVVEAPARSGALITASWALEQGRECFIVPGPIGSRASEGGLSFLHEYAGSARIVPSVAQLLDDLGLVDHDAVPAIGPRAAATLAEVGGTATRIGRELIAGRSTVDELVAMTGLPVATVLGALTILEMRGLAVSAYGRYRPAGMMAADGAWLDGRPVRMSTGSARRLPRPRQRC
jgi:DNA processing protein